MKKLFLALLLVFLFPISAFASELTLEGFRDLKFGSSFDSVKNKMKLIPNKKDPSNPLKFYKLEGDSLKFNGHKIHLLQYAYYEDKFVGILIYTRQPKSSTEINDYLKEVFGPENKTEINGKRKGIPDMKISKIWNNNDIFIKTINEIRAERNSVFFSYNMFFKRNLSTLNSVELSTELTEI